MTSALISHRPPDVEANLTPAIEADPDLLSGIRVWTVDVIGFYPQWITQHLIQIDVRASSKKAAWTKAWDTVALVMAQTSASWPDGVVNNIALISGPSWLPDENGAPRYVTRLNLTCHPTQQ